MNVLQTLGLTRERVEALSRIAPPATMGGPDATAPRAKRTNQSRRQEMLQVLRAVSLVDSSMTTAQVLDAGASSMYVLRRMLALGLLKLVQPGRGGHHPTESVWAITPRGESAARNGEIPRGCCSTKPERGALRPVSSGRDTIRNQVRRALEAGPLSSARIAKIIGDTSIYASAVCSQLEARGEVQRVIRHGHRRMEWQLKSVNWKEDTHA